MSYVIHDIVTTQNYRALVAGPEVEYFMEQWAKMDTYDRIRAFCIALEAGADRYKLREAAIKETNGQK